MEVIKVTRTQVLAAQAAIELSKISGRPVDPLVLKIANAKRATEEKATSK